MNCIFSLKLVKYFKDLGKETPKWCKSYGRGIAALLEEVRSSIRFSTEPSLILLVYRTKQTSALLSLLALPEDST
jgi:hypothetical protein